MTEAKRHANQRAAAEIHDHVVTIDGEPYRCQLCVALDAYHGPRETP